MELDTNTLLKQYEQLYGLTIPNVEDKLQKVDEDGQQLIKQLVYSARKSYYEIYAQKLTKTQKPPFESKDIIASSMIPTKDILEVSGPINVQAFTSFVSEAYANPPALAKAISNNLNSKHIVHLVNITVPSLFGFFTTKEQSAQASSFYTVLSSLVPFEVFTAFCAPFFLATSMEIFAQNLVQSVFFTNYLKKFDASRFVDYTIREFKRNIRYLPSAQSSLLRFLSFQWNAKKLWTFLIQALIVPQFCIHSAYSPFAHAFLVNFQIEDLVQEFERRTNSFPSLDLTVSWPYEVPGDFIFMDGTVTFQLLLTKADVESLLFCQDHIKYYGCSLQKFYDELKSSTLEPFALIFYPKMPTPPLFPTRPLLFHGKVIDRPPSDQNVKLWVSIKEAGESIRKTPVEVVLGKLKTCNSLLDQTINQIDTSEILRYGLLTELSELTTSCDILEQILSHKMYAAELYSFYKTSEDFEQKTALLYATHLKKNKKNHFWTKIDAIKGSPYIKFYTALTFITCTESQFLKPIKDLLPVMENIFGDIILTKQKNIDYIGMNPILQQRIMENNMLLSFVNSDCAFIDRAIVFFNYLQRVEDICNITSIDDSRESFDQILHFAIVINNAKWILKTALLLDGILFSDERFATHIGDMYMNVWEKFKSSFIQFLSCNVDLYMQFVNLVSGDTLKSAD